jgi:hypothetical protein
MKHFMLKKSRIPDKKIPAVRKRRGSEVHRDPDEPIEEAPETLERAIGPRWSLKEKTDQPRNRKAS